MITVNKRKLVYDTGYGTGKESVPVIAKIHNKGEIIYEF